MISKSQRQSNARNDNLVPAKAKKKVAKKKPLSQAEKRKRLDDAVASSPARAAREWKQQEDHCRKLAYSQPKLMRTVRADDYEQQKPSPEVIKIMENLLGYIESDLRLKSPA